MSRLLFYIEIATIQSGDMWLVAIGLQSATNGRTKSCSTELYVDAIAPKFPKSAIERNRAKQNAVVLFATQRWCKSVELKLT